MKNFIIHDIDGNILRTGTCPDNMLSIQAQSGEFVLEGVADDSAQVVNISNNQLEAKPVDTAALISTVQEELRVIRNGKLLQTDWTQLSDAPLTATQKTEWQAYRQALRDLPSSYPNETDLENVVFPTEPS